MGIRFFISNHASESSPDSKVSISVRYTNGRSAHGICRTAQKTQTVGSSPTKATRKAVLQKAPAKWDVFLDKYVVSDCNRVPDAESML